MSERLVDFIRSMYGTSGAISLHEPRFTGNEKKFLNECIDSTFVSSVGKYVEQFEKMVCDYTGSQFAVATMNGTAALHLALVLADVKPADEVLTQAMTFVATANAISYIGASPIFVDNDQDNLGLSPSDLARFLELHADFRSDGFSYNKKTGRRIKACVPMHTLGHPVKLDEILQVCRRYNIFVIEDAAESLGSFYKGEHTGTIAPIGTLSFNGNKTVTTGGGGMLLIQDKELAKRAKFLSTTAKEPHAWKFYHSEVGYNYRLPNLNAALGCAQMENLSAFLENKRETASRYKSFLAETPYKFWNEPDGSRSNFWLNAIVLESKEQRDALLEFSSSRGVLMRPMWELMNTLPAFKDCQKTELQNSRFYSDRIVCLPSSVRITESQRAS